MQLHEMGRQRIHPYPYMRRSGLTLVELAVALAIVAILACLLLPALRKARESARSAACVSSLRQMTIILEQYAADTGYLLPAFFGNHASYLYTYPADACLWPDFLVAQNRASPDIFRCPSSDRHASTILTERRVNYAMNGNAAGIAQQANPFGLSPCGSGIAKGFAIGSGGLLSADRIRYPGQTVWMVDAAAGSGETCRWDIPFRAWHPTGVYAMFTVAADDRLPLSGQPDAAARHNGKANVAFFDGHVASFRGGQSYTGTGDGSFLHWDGLF